MVWRLLPSGEHRGSIVHSTMGVWNSKLYNVLPNLLAYVVPRHCVRTPRIFFSYFFMTGKLFLNPSVQFVSGAGTAARFNLLQTRSGLYGVCPNNPWLIFGRLRWEVKTPPSFSNNAIYFGTNSELDRTQERARMQNSLSKRTYVQTRFAPHFSYKTFPSIMTFQFYWTCLQGAIHQGLRWFEPANCFWQPQRHTEDNWVVWLQWVPATLIISKKRERHGKRVANAEWTEHVQTE